MAARGKDNAHKPSSGIHIDHFIFSLLYSLEWHHTLTTLSTLIKETNNRRRKYSYKT
jgi:hypothetical protein